MAAGGPEFEKDIALLSVMGIGLRSHTGVGEKMFRAWAIPASTSR